MEIRTLDNRGRTFLSNEEGMRLKPYKDRKGIPTIGIGCTYYPNGKKVTLQDKPLNDAGAAWQLFDIVADHFYMTVYSTTRDDINQNQFNALVSLCYNIGSTAFKESTVLKLVNQDPNDPDIADAFRMWRWVTIEHEDGSTTRVPDLLPRRNREVGMYFS